jgi:hypothetical protein
MPHCNRRLSSLLLAGEPLVFECLPAGTYTVVFAANSTANDAFPAGPTGCLECVPVSVDDATWGSIKSTFR